jgi:hypothetical protein
MKKLSKNIDDDDSFTRVKELSKEQSNISQ